jgi:LysR family transcriptional regulator, glycine cleavage system transcriptional activator
MTIFHSVISRDNVIMVSPYRAVPPLATLRTFEAVARKGGFTRAADDLAITQSAVSHQIRALETFLGVPLFVRRNSGIELTEDGGILLDSVRAGMDLILRASDRIRSRQQVGVLTIAVPAAFATWWLVPRLGRFASRHPHIEVRIATMDYREPDFDRDGLDAAIVLRPGRERVRLNEMLLLRERIFPVCSPTLIERMSLRTPADLARHTLIEEDADAGSPLSWASWLARFGIPDRPAISRLRFTHCSVALSAAIDGLGVALGRSPMIDAELAAGRLRRPFGNKAACMAPESYALAWSKARADDQRLVAFRDFVLDESCGCELAAGPCGAPPSPRDAGRDQLAAARAAHRAAVAS